MTRRRAALSIAVALLLAGCGSTVQYKAQVTSGLAPGGNSGAFGSSGTDGQLAAPNGSSALGQQTTGTASHDYAGRALQSSATASTFERGYGTALDQLRARGNVTTKNHLSVFLEGCPEDVRAWTNGIEPEIHRLGTPVELSTLSCTG